MTLKPSLTTKFLTSLTPELLISLILEPPLILTILDPEIQLLYLVLPIDMPCNEIKYKLNQQNVQKLNVLFGFESFRQYNY